jgi:hypothetical protein
VAQTLSDQFSYHPKAVGASLPPKITSAVNSKYYKRTVDQYQLKYLFLTKV